MNQPSSRPAFDEFADNYDEALNQGLSLTGESKDYYAEGRACWLARHLAKYIATHNPAVIDYGCGTGSAAPTLRQHLNAASVLGLDISEEELKWAREHHLDAGTSFENVDHYQPRQAADIVYCNGTFHHIPPQARPGVVRYIFNCLRPGGIFALWENNPWNPGTRFIMSKVPFDHDAITLTPPESRRLLRAGGFEILRTDSLFYFPRALKFLRPMERFLSLLPLGGQYLVLARKGADS